MNNEIMSSTSSTTTTNNAYVYPLLQLHDSNLVIDELVTKKFFHYAPKLSKIYLAAGYFNLIEEYEKLIVSNTNCEYNILISSPKANGFFNANGFAHNIPKIYSHLEENFFKLIKLNSQDNRIRLYEYERANWTFHAKGLWYYSSDVNNNKLPILTIVGSSNFGYRSVYRDIEAQLVIHSKDVRLRNDLNEVNILLYINFNSF